MIGRSRGGIAEMAEARTFPSDTHSGSTDRPATTLGVDDVLDGEDVVPGFTRPVANVFADPLG
jgi:hypothetical protein